MVRRQLVPRWLPLLSLLAAVEASAAAQPDIVQIFAAGSLRGVVADLAAEAGPLLGVYVQPSFGGSGSMRERIEKGDAADLLMSADVGSPRKLAMQGKTVVPPIAFARNRECIVSRRAAHVTAANLLDRMMAAGTRLKTSTPIADPSGDYAWTLFARAETLRPGAQDILEAKANAFMKVEAKPATPTQSAAAALFSSNAIDMSITYCSGAAALEKEVPDLVSLAVPPNLDPHPVYGLAILSNKPQALRVALYLLSEKGQAIIARNGLVPLVEPAGPAP